MSVDTELTVDVIVVGAGTAGCVMAARLSEDPACRVLLVEAGGDEPYVEAGDAAKLHADPNRDWRYPARLTRRAEQDVVLSRGRMVGGSGAINGAIFFRGLPEDYDGWGSPLWSYDALLPLFRRVEHDFDFAGPHHGSDGPIPVVRPPEEQWYPYTDAFYESSIETGFAEKPDLSAPDGSGIGPIPLNRFEGRRVSADIAYLDPAAIRPNLLIWTNAASTKIIFDGMRATGVAILRDRRLELVRADKVVLCAGAIATPHLLMLSGVGPASHLKEHGIPVVIDMPGVGSNASDHPMLAVSVAVTPQHLPSPDIYPYFQAMLVHSTPSGSRNDMHTWPTYVPPTGTHPVTATHGTQSGLVLGSLLQQPASRGEVRLRSGDALASPKLAFNHLEDAGDLRRFREAIDVTLEILAGKPLAKLVGRRISPSDEDLATARSFENWAHISLATAKHTTGTCRMGSTTDTFAVADFDGTIHGVENVTIADLSLCPQIVRAPPNNTAFVIGERIADVLKGEAAVGSKTLVNA
ncbi:MAG: choline dehydrogenase [Gaiellaceae bacterium]|jgi:predicted dehydrogenase (TIGR03970 family)|nr:choline dehydrogenase [Gaiellaceae bacterium]